MSFANYVPLIVVGSAALVGVHYGSQAARKWMGATAWSNTKGALTGMAFGAMLVNHGCKDSTLNIIMDGAAYTAGKAVTRPTGADSLNDASKDALEKTKEVAKETGDATGKVISGGVKAIQKIGVGTGSKDNKANGGTADKPAIINPTPAPDQTR